MHHPVFQFLHLLFSMSVHFGFTLLALFFIMFCFVGVHLLCFLSDTYMVYQFCCVDWCEHFILSSKCFIFAVFQHLYVVVDLRG